MTFLDSVSNEELVADPYPVFARMRRECPVAYHPASDTWIVASWDDCSVVGAIDPSVLGATTRSAPGLGPAVTNADGDLHRWLRAGIDPPLRPKAVQGYIESATRPVAVEYLDRILPQGGAEATGELLERISVRVIGDVLGLHDVDDDTRQRWFRAIAAGFGNLLQSEQVRLDMEAAGRELDTAMVEHVARVTAFPDGSALSSMVHQGLEGGRPRTYDDLRGTLHIIIAGGFQEPGHALAATVLGLLTWPEQYALLVDDPKTYVPKAVHEGLRWLAPFSVTERHALADIEVRGTTIPAGSEIALALGSANHDETRWSDPTVFDMRRPHLGHAAFGYGVHFCAGHFVARRLEHIVLEEIVRRMPRLRLDPDSQPKITGYSMRGVKHLPVLW